MGKAIKKLAPIAIGIGIGMATGGFGTAASAGAWGSAGGLGSIGTAGVSGGLFGGLSASTIMQGAGLLTNVASGIQSQKYADKQNSFQNEQTKQANLAEDARNKYNQLLQKRSRLESIRVGRLEQGRIGAATAGSGLGASGTSSFTGAIGSIGSQTSANLGNINVAQDVGNQISGFNIAGANAGSAANSAGSKSTMWTNASTLGGTFLENGKGIANIFGKD